MPSAAAPGAGRRVGEKSGRALVSAKAAKGGRLASFWAASSVAAAGGAGAAGARSGRNGHSASAASATFAAKQREGTRTDRDS